MIDMIIPSFFSGLFSTMNVFANNFDDIRFHLNDIYMICLMIGWMLLFTMYGPNNMHIDGTTLSLIIFIIAMIWCIRNQFLISDKEYLNGMIPHHSMAITMSKRILEKTNNDKIKVLANRIISSQSQEIKEMNDILNNSGY